MDWHCLKRLERTCRIVEVSIFVMLCLPVGWANGASALDTPPNIVVIVSDDQRYGTTREYMPQTQKLIFDQGVTFSNAYVTTPACCPSRASIFTGRYAGRHQVLTNYYRLHQKTFMKRLSEKGYFLGLVGKYLNTASGRPKEGFDYWVSFRGGSVDYNDPQLNVNGRWKNAQGYVTHILRDYAVSFIKRAAKQKKPFALVFTPNSPHGPSHPAKEDEEKFSDLSAFTTPAHTYTREGKPTWVTESTLSKKRMKRLRGYPVQQLRCLASLDTAVATIVKTLEETGMLSNTVVFYISDNGVMWGEHGLNRKDVGYEPAVHVPFAVRSPLFENIPSRSEALVANIDIAPTIYDLAGIDFSRVDGASLVPLLQGKQQAWKRRALFLDGYGNFADKRPSFFGYHTGDFKVLRSSRGGLEAYNIKIDPYELNNLSSMKMFKPQLREAQKSIRVFRRKTHRINDRKIRRDWMAQKNPYKKNKGILKMHRSPHSRRGAENAD